MKITIYDGAETIGGNKIFVEDKERGVFLDFGLNFAKYNKYFAEFLSERVSRGIHDPLYLGLIPKLNVYRSDLIPSDVDLSQFPRLNVEATLISHAHLDHCGSISFLSKEIPLLASSMTLAILKAMRDCGRAHFSTEVCYYSQRFSLEDETRVLASNNSPKVPYLGRDLICADKPNYELLEFLCTKPGQDSKNTKKIKPGEIFCLSERQLPLEIEAFEVDHSIYGTTAFILHGENSIAYTGDIRLHGRRAEETKKFVREANNVSVLIVEGTRAGSEGENFSERDVYENCLSAVEKAKDLVIADFSPRNFERLETFKEIAEKTSRELVVTVKDAYMLNAVEIVDGIDRMDRISIYNELKSEHDKWETEVVMDLFGDRYLDPESIRSCPDRYILCFSYYDIKHLLDIKPQKGVYIYSSSEAFNEEQEFDFRRLYEWLKVFNFETVGFRIEKDETYFEKGYHTSGHASKEDLSWIIEKIDPDVVIPVHTEKADWFEEEFENAKILKNGESYEF